jgi:type II secretory pathway component PulC
VRRGYRVYPRGDAALFGGLGFDPGDLVLSINGRALDDPARGTRVFAAAINASEVGVRLERAERLEHFVLANHHLR